MRCFDKKIFKGLSTKKALAIILLSSSLFACSSSDEEDPSTKVAELSDLDNAFDVEIVWDRSVGDGVNDYFSRIKPIVAYNKVYSASREGDVVAFDKESGDEVWQADLSDIHDERSFWDSRVSALVAGGPVAGMKKVFLGTENGDVFALDAETGELIWQAKIKGEVITPPAIDSGILVVNSASGVLKGFDASTGEEIWKVEQDVPALTLRGISTPVIASGGVIIGSGKGELGVYILEKGQAGWTTEVGEATGSTELQRVIDVDSAPVVFGDKVYAISARGNLVAIELKSGRILWKRQYSSYRQISVYRNDIYITNTRGHIYALNRINGIERWSNVELTNRSVTGPAVVDDYVVVGDFEGYLHWLNQETGEIVSRHQVDSSGIYSTPTVVDDIIYTQSRDGDLQVISTPKIVSAAQ
ncbi:outer membrane protein assembly factor BamB [Colwellia psychrerythraea]|uniref:Outer membrane protein assembly factor BamB n=1 Tax=Colwellia psychrerythraea TaxID=28229 RepID=A0A099KXY3_COLPS|nr:outer membrane protein assembly factor BamB [Colwellia psychrerythraea]KGJ95471.1 Outer membrane assembly lipoprotein YfgL [Colwellia psychrerythraea]